MGSGRDSSIIIQQIRYKLYLDACKTPSGLPARRRLPAIAQEVQVGPVEGR